VIHRGEQHPYISRHPNEDSGWIAEFKEDCLCGVDETALAANSTKHLSHTTGRHSCMRGRNFPSDGAKEEKQEWDVKALLKLRGPTEVRVRGAEEEDQDWKLIGMS